MKSVLSKFSQAFALTSIIIACSHQTVREPAAVPTSPLIRGLERIENLDAWIKSFSGTQGFRQAPQNLASQVEKFIKVSQPRPSNQSVYEYIFQNFAGPYQDPESLKILASELYKVRENLRTVNHNSGSSESREQSMLLSFLAEEALAVSGALKPSIFELKTKDRSSLCTKKATLNNLTLCDGDIMLSKGASGSSSFITRISDFPGNFSHSTLAHIDTHGKLLLPESDIADGTKLRTPQKEYIDSRKTKLFVYRLNSTSDEQTKQLLHIASNSSQKIVSEMTSKLKEMGQDETQLPNHSAYDYDFTMNAIDASKIFCSELTMRAYQLGGASPSTLNNPYPKALWSTLTEPTFKAFFSQFMGIQAEQFPSPSDTELNPKFDLAALQINTEKLKFDRIDLAMIDTLIWFLNRDPQKSIEFLALFKNQGNEAIQASDMAPFVAAGLIKEEEVSGFLTKLPKNITPKQALFFGFLNEKLTPTVRQAATQKFAESHKVGPLELRAFVTSVISDQLGQFIEALKKMKQP